MEFWLRGEEWLSQSVLKASEEIIPLFAEHMGVGDGSVSW